MKKKILQYSITFGVCAIISFIVLVIRGVFSTRDTKELMRYFTDTFFAVGVLCACFGLLIMVSNGGAFEMLVYGVSRFFSLFKKNPNKVKYVTFYDYHVARAEKEKPQFLYFIIVGAIYVGISLIFLYQWYQAEPSSTAVLIIK